MIELKTKIVTKTMIATTADVDIFGTVPTVP